MLHFPTPIRLNQTYTYGGTTWLWDGVGWRILRTTETLPGGALVPAVLTSLVYEVGLGVTEISLTAQDLFGNTRVLSPMAPLEPVDVHLNGVRLVPDDGSGLIGDYTVNHLDSTITLLTAVPAGSILQASILVPPGQAALGTVLVRQLLDFDTDWTLETPVGGLKDGVNTVFPAYHTLGAPQPAALGGAAELSLYVDGVRQHPGTDYTVSGASITMTEPPAVDASFWGLWHEPRNLDVLTPSRLNLDPDTTPEATLAGGVNRTAGQLVPYHFDGGAQVAPPAYGLGFCFAGAPDGVLLHRYPVSVVQPGPISATTVMIPRHFVQSYASSLGGSPAHTRLTQLMVSAAGLADGSSATDLWRLSLDGIDGATAVLDLDRNAALSAAPADLLPARIDRDPVGDCLHWWGGLPAGTIGLNDKFSITLTKTGSPADLSDLMVQAWFELRL